MLTLYIAGTVCFKTISIISQGKAFCRKRIPQPSSSSYARKETADKDITKTSKNGDRKIMPPARITSGSPIQIRKQKQFSQFRRTSTKTISTKKTQGGYIQTMRQGFKGMINSPTFQCLQLIPNIQRVTSSTNLVMKIVSHARLRSKFIEIISKLRRKKLH